MKKKRKKVSKLSIGRSFYFFFKGGGGARGIVIA
jgi:hypothetical protein